MRRRHRISMAALAVLLAAVLASVALWYLTSRSISAREQDILRSRTEEVRTSVTARLNTLATLFTAIGAAVTADPSPAAVDRALNRAVTPLGLAGIALVDMSGPAPTIRASAGARPAIGPEATTALDRLSPATPLTKTPVIGSGPDRRIGFASLIAGSPTGDALYGELPLDSFDPDVVRSILGDTADVDSVLYADATPSPEDVLFATTRSLPFGEPVQSVEVPVGSDSTLLQTRPRVQLSGGAARVLPWVLLAGGVISGIGLAVIVEMIARRRDDALIAADEQAQESMSILDAAHEAFVAIDAGNRISGWSRQAELLVGWRADEVIGRDAFETLVPERYRRRLRDELAQLTDTAARGTVRRFDTDAVARDGRLIPVGVSAWRSCRGTCEVHLIVHDNTERRRAADALARARDEALEASRLKSAFVATISHEIRTPMNAIIGMSGLLLDTDLDTEQHEYASTVRTSATALLGIVNDILDFSKVEAGRLEIEAEDVDVRAVIDDVVDLFAEEARGKGLALTTTVASDVPAVVRGDGGRVRQVLVNLVGNAVKFTTAGEVAVSCSARAAGDGAPGGGTAPAGADEVEIRFEVRDTGPGVPEGQLDRLFDSFTQLDSSTTRQFGGTGLGLAIARQLTELMGGQIGAASTAGEGSTFWFTIVVTRVAGPAGEVPAPALARPEQAGPAGAPAGTRVLVAEDNQVNQRVARRMLERLGCSVDVVSDGQEAVEATLGGEYAIVFMDAQMPELDGYDATREIRRREGGARRTPVVAMTAAAMTDDRERALDAGMDDYVAKPVNLPDLAAAVARWSTPGDDG